MSKALWNANIETLAWCNMQARWEERAGCKCPGSRGLASNTIFVATKYDQRRSVGCDGLGRQAKALCALYLWTSIQQGLHQIRSKRVEKSWQAKKFFACISYLFSALFYNRWTFRIFKQFLFLDYSHAPNDCLGACDCSAQRPRFSVNGPDSINWNWAVFLEHLLYLVFCIFVVI